MTTFIATNSDYKYTKVLATCSHIRIRIIIVLLLRGL